MAAPLTPGQIYLADQRGLLESPQQQRYCTLNFGTYAADGRGPLGSLRAVNEELLAPGQAVTLVAAHATHLVLLPILGAVSFHTAAGQVGTADVEQVQVLNLSPGSTVELRNPYEQELITFLHLWLDAAPDALATSDCFEYRVGALDNQLTELVPPAPQRQFTLHLGCFQGRREAVYQVSDPNHRLFAFVLAGAFEVEGRLLHEKDALALWETRAVELEALSNNAFVLLVELPG
jgi:redox-sensitive bicupin YhaK (pirin superfamily)